MITITIKGSNQEVFSRSVRRLAQQDWQRSVSDDGECLYRSGNGIACTIGVLIDNDEYSPAIEGHDVNSLIEADILDAECDTDLLRELQWVHDDTNSGEDMRWALRNVARMFALTIPPELQEAEE